MKIQLALLQLNSTESLFLAGKNFGSKIKPGDKNISEITYDTETGLVSVLCEGEEALVRGFMSINRKTDKPIKEIPKQDAPFAGTKAQVTGPERTIRTAQVETPIQKVQGIPGRKAKFQGQESQGE